MIKYVCNTILGIHVGHRFAVITTMNLIIRLHTEPELGHSKNNHTSRSNM